MMKRIARWATLVLTAGVLMGPVATPASAASFYDTQTVSSLRNLVGAMEYYALFSDDEDYEGVTTSELAEWGWTPSSFIKVDIWVEGDGEAYRVTAQDTRPGGTQYSYSSAEPFNGVPAGSRAASVPQPGYVPEAAGVTIYDVSDGIDVSGLGLALAAVPLADICTASALHPGTHAARSSLPDHTVACEQARLVTGATATTVLKAMVAAGGAGVVALIAKEFHGDGSAPARTPDWVGSPPNRPAPSAPPSSLPTYWRAAAAAAKVAHINNLDPALARAVTDQCLALVASAYQSLNPHRDCKTLPIFASGRDVSEATDHDLDAITQINPAWTHLNYRSIQRPSTPWHTGEVACANPATGQQCDEYPFFSTVQGYPSTPQPSLRLIDGNQNMRQGSLLGEFYRFCGLNTGTLPLQERAFLSIPLPAHTEAPTTRICNAS